MSETIAALMWYDRERHVWNRFDQDTLAGVDPEDLGLILMGSLQQVTLHEWLKMQDRLKEPCPACGHVREEDA